MPGEYSDAEYSLDSYDFVLPDGQIAQSPALKRTDSKLMVLRPADPDPALTVFSDILNYLPPKCLLVANNTCVVPARLKGKRKGGGKAEVLLLSPLPLLKPRELSGQELINLDSALSFLGNEESPKSLEHDSAEGWRMAEANTLVRPAKKIKPGDFIYLAPCFMAQALEAGEFGHFSMNIFWQGDLAAILNEYGSIPLPPYIRRPEQEGLEPPAWGTDKERYQTVYAKQDKNGSVAAPTAGLHFTPELRSALLRSGREWAEVTLHVGYGTFSPVRTGDIRDHQMHAEYVELPEETAAAIHRAKAEGRAVIAVGTTSARVLEGVWEELYTKNGPAKNSVTPAGKLRGYSGWISIFIYPGKKIQVIDGLLTNFHLPKSSLLMLVCALAGRKKIMDAYQTALAEGFSFFSYGDSMLIL